MNVHEEIKDLKERLIESEEQVGKEEPKEFPQEGDEFYCIDIDGEIFKGWFNSGEGIDVGMDEIGNAFKTRKDAEFTVERLKVLQELKKYSKASNPSESKWGMYYNPISEKIEINWTCMQGAELYFESFEMAVEALVAVGEDRIKKYYLCVEE